MTTMLVQLRRVVYLLVLLQCCAVVAYANNATLIGGTHEKSVADKVDDLTSKILETASEGERIIAITNDARVKCTEAVKVAVNDAEKASEFAKEIEGYSKNDDDLMKYVDGKEKEEMMQPWKKAVDGANDAGEKAKVGAAEAIKLCAKAREEATKSHSTAT
ncbi:uncharacterized protein TM35_000122870 [Trypanosoma theileri]|uniref:Uncharacterized protein n=1 Tax=Trypanosoma theileri TaxID=67003 RepID=A0A1X0NXV5_9TRYP|nr:uncharacterized protein TM35_000122870 [Trypanosoma theileri]ORC89512.1 hypothetical protein TM35_000122870 [Trypanosoma theileri]